MLSKGGINIVGEVLKGGGTFYEMNHYPDDDVFDSDSGAQYYYHAHRGTIEHGHFHTFLRATGMPEGSRPLEYPQASELWPTGDAAICHLIAISMDEHGYPTELFTTNRWVTDEAWYPASQAIPMVKQFNIDHAFPSWPVNRWISAMLALYGPHIEALMRHRDKVINQWQGTYSESDIFEDRRLDVIGHHPISVEEDLAVLAALLK